MWDFRISQFGCAMVLCSIWTRQKSFREKNVRSKVSVQSPIFRVEMNDLGGCNKKVATFRLSGADISNCPPALGESKSWNNKILEKVLPKIFAFLRPVQLNSPEPIAPNSLSSSFLILVCLKEKSIPWSCRMASLDQLSIRSPRCWLMISRRCLPVRSGFVALKLFDGSTRYPVSLRDPGHVDSSHRRGMFFSFATSKNAATSRS